MLLKNRNGPLHDQFSLKLTNGSQDIELKATIHCGRINPLVKDH
jgi:hypothetical protein